MRNLLKILIIILILLICIILIYKYTHRSVDTSEKISWQKREPELFNNVGYSKLVESAPQIVNKNLSESELKLEGVITNPFGIRDDILEFIVANIPSNNESALRAAILSAQINQQIYYGDITQDEAMKLSNRDM